MIHCIIVDDEQHAVDVLVHYVQQAPQLNLLACYTNPIDALPIVQEHKVDLIFLDIQMPELSGIDFIKTIQGKSKVILTTAYAEFALEGYDLCVVDYLLKPMRLPRFLAAVQKAVEQIGYAKESPPELDYIFVKAESKGKLIKIELNEIDYIEGMRNYVAIHCQGKKTLVNTSMKYMEEELPGKNFIRIHKSFIVPKAGITGIEGNLLRLKGVANAIPIGENYKDGLMELVKGKLIG